MARFQVRMSVRSFFFLNVFTARNEDANENYIASLQEKGQALPAQHAMIRAHQVMKQVRLGLTFPPPLKSDKLLHVLVSVASVWWSIQTSQAETLWGPISSDVKRFNNVKLIRLIDKMWLKQFAFVSILEWNSPVLCCYPTGEGTILSIWTTTKGLGKNARCLTLIFGSKFLPQFLCGLMSSLAEENGRLQFDMIFET